MAFAALGAAEVLAVLPGHRQARALLTAVAIAIGRPAADAGWPWPEPRLSYANAALPEALLAAGAALDSTVARRRRAAPARLAARAGRPATGTCRSSPVGGRGPT